MSDLSDSVEVWPAAAYLLVLCAAALTLWITQAAFSHAAATEESV